MTLRPLSAPPISRTAATKAVESDWNRRLAVMVAPRLKVSKPAPSAAGGRDVTWVSGFGARLAAQSGSDDGAWTKGVEAQAQGYSGTLQTRASESRRRYMSVEVSRAGAEA